MTDTDEDAQAAKENDARLLEVLAELKYRRLARELVPGIGNIPNRTKLAPALCKYTGLQPDAMQTLSNYALTPFIEMAIEQKTGKRPRNRKEKLPPVVLNGRGKPVHVLGEEKPALSDAQYDVIQALLDAGSKGLNKDQIANNSRHSDAVNILKRVSEKDPDWAKVISLAGKVGRKYRIIDHL